MSAERLLATMRSLSPLATKTGCVMTERSSGALSPAVLIALQLGASGLQGNGLVAVLSTLLEPGEVVFRGRLPSGVGGKNRKFLGSLKVSAALR